MAAAAPSADDGARGDPNYEAERDDRLNAIVASPLPIECDQNANLIRNNVPSNMWVGTSSERDGVGDQSRWAGDEEESKRLRRRELRRGEEWERNAITATDMCSPSPAGGAGPRLMHEYDIDSVLSGDNTSTDHNHLSGTRN